MAWLEMALHGGPPAPVLEQHGLADAQLLGTWVDSTGDVNYCYRDGGGITALYEMPPCKCGTCDDGPIWSHWYPPPLNGDPRASTPPPRWLAKIIR